MLLNFDLAGAEWWVTAYLCRDEAMLDLARRNPRPSPHPITGSRMTGLSPELIVKEDKLIGKNNDPIVIASLRNDLPEVKAATILPRTMSIRQAAKKANHGLNYREGYRTFALKNEMDEREAGKIVDLYRKKSYPGLLRWYDSIDEEIRKTRTMTNCFGRKVYFMGQLNDDTFRAATAFKPQSTVGDVTNNALPLLINDESYEFEPAELLAPVHDSILIDYHDHNWSRMARFAAKLTLDYMSPTLDYGEPFKLDVDAKGGFDWGHLIEFKLTPDIEQLARNLEECWETAMTKRAKSKAA